ncbi:MFS transporter [Flaviaesturariibacter flavus]|uniref:Alpha-ketoglutarate permease n=1 Tax=Flaviaesturariibacter flavus TaxID=2502780 RepID=A0A4R1B796_9BACT|nr:MFS transporter [Flaviaesturariibacter flavus]TCJ12065.1 MFS transporter [Flaviaesturariibacter flavus]
MQSTDNSRAGHRRRLRAIAGGSAGNLVEWYDWYAYAAFSLYFSPRFFPGADPTAQLLNSAGIFAVGFFMRPIGAWLFGRLADRKGRKLSMTLSILLMSFGSLLIACTPAYDRIGFWAPVILFSARLLQGLSVGGEYGTSATYLSEMAHSRHRGFYSSFQYVTLIGGQLVALAVQLLLQRLLPESGLRDWGWRIPFFIGAALAVFVFYLRRHLEETEAFAEAQEYAGTGSLRELMRHPRAVGIVVGMTMGGTLAFYTWSVYMQKFLVNTVHLPLATATRLSFWSLLIFAALQPAFGALSDRIGRRPLLLAFGFGGTLATYPLLLALSHVTTPGAAFALMLLGLLLVSGYTSINAVVKAELFPAGVRALGVGFPYAIAAAVFGGTAEYVALWAKKAGHETWFYLYVSACVCCSLIVYLRMRETGRTTL